MLHKSTPTSDDDQRAHITFKAVTTVDTDEGTFEAIISTEGVDREKDVVSAAGMVAALKRWNRPIPLSWGHSTTAENIFGSVDPTTAKELGREVVVQGQVHLDSKVGAEAWRSFKSRAVGFSFGYLILASTKRKGGGRAISDLDVFEITATPTPMNNETRVLSTKELRAESERLARELEETVIPDIPEQPKAPEVDLAQELQETKGLLAEMRVELDALKKKAEETDKEPVARSVDPLRKRSEELALEVSSGGMSLRRPPTQVKEQPRELVPLDELRRESRDLMTTLLSDTE